MSLDDIFLKKAIECINAHLDDSDYDRDTFAADMGASASTLYNKLRALTGMNVSSFIRDIRLKAACRMAKENPELRVSDIAYRVGFKDPKYFATSFKKEMGIQPKEYFEQLRADDGASATSPKK
jgi:AraC-like DNA-binding protein